MEQYSQCKLLFADFIPNWYLKVENIYYNFYILPNFYFTLIMLKLYITL